MQKVYMIGIEYPLGIILQTYGIWILFFLVIVCSILARWYYILQYVYDRKIQIRTSHLKEKKRKHTEKELLHAIDTAKTDSIYIQSVIRYLAFHYTNSYAGQEILYDVIPISDSEKQQIEHVIYHHRALSDTLRSKIQHTLHAMRSI